MVNSCSMAPTLDYSTIIKEAEAFLRAKLGQSRQPLIKRRLRFLLLLKTSPPLSCAKAGAAIGLSAKGAEAMWKLYRKEGFEVFTDYPFKGRTSSLSPEDKQWLLEELKTEPAVSLAQSAERIKQHTGAKKALSPQAVHYIFKALKIKKKTGRPAHIHKEEAKVEAFKKRVPGLKSSVWRRPFL